MDYDNAGWPCESVSNIVRRASGMLRTAELLGALDGPTMNDDEYDIAEMIECLARDLGFEYRGLATYMTGMPCPDDGDALLLEQAQQMPEGSSALMKLAVNGRVFVGHLRREDVLRVIPNQTSLAA